MSVKVWSDVVGCWNAKGAVDDGALEELLPAGVDGLGRRDALWAVMDKNGGGSLSLPEIDGWFTRETLAREERGGFKLKGGQRKSTLAQYAKPCLIRSFYRANSASGSSDRSDNKVVTRDEFRFFCHCFGCALDGLAVRGVAERLETKEGLRLGELHGLGVEGRGAEAFEAPAPVGVVDQVHVADVLGDARAEAVDLSAYHHHPCALTH